MSKFWLVWPTRASRTDPKRLPNEAPREGVFDKPQAAVSDGPDTF